MCTRISLIQFLQSVPFDLAADNSCGVIWLHVRIRGLGNLYPIHPGTRCQRFEWTHLGGAARAGSQSCDSAALADDPRIWDGVIARSNSTCAKRHCASRNFLLPGRYINFSAHLERSRRHFLAGCKDRPCLGLSQCYRQPRNHSKPRGCRLPPHPTERPCERADFGGGSVRFRYYFFFGRLLGIGACDIEGETTVSLVIWACSVANTGSHHAL